MTSSVKEKKVVKIGDYTLTGKIGQGGVAEIYKARQESLERDVAIKILSLNLTDDPDIVRRFERESKVIAKLNHPNIVHVIDKGSASGRYYFVMEYIKGTSLREVIDSDKIALATKMEMIVQVCKALDYAHNNGVIHRDIKPGNVLIDKQGNALVADFGIAQIVGTPDTEMTASDMIMGTLSYMSPEQKISSTNIDQTTDLYAVGVMLYEILVGKKPLGKFLMPSEINPSLSAEYDQIISKCLAQDAKDRYQRAVELKDAILEIIHRPDFSVKTDDVTMHGADSFLGKCRYLDTIKENRYSSTILVENRVNKQLYIIKKHSRGEHGRKEAKILNSMKHENIIDIFGSGGDKKNTVIIIEYAKGGSLADRMARKYSWEDAFNIIMAVTSGLEHAHKHNIVHTNIRPSNILFDEEDVPKLSDFGMPVHYQQNSKTKNWYKPPEHKVSKQGDVYALGVILHQMITGRNPSYNSAGALMLDDIKRDLPESILNIISKFLAIRVSRRYTSCEEILTDWDAYNIRQAELRSLKNKKAKPQTVIIEKKTPIWVYFSVAIGAVIVALTILYISGFLK
ncbi:MAG: hypothetical protein DWP97_04660 [Calditrichaeota bacterium]|nr:MAG: hypothetical protein DWP97_04660 [Calditrichota bacterium]